MSPSPATETAKVRLLTIIAGEELVDGILENLRTIGVTGFTVARVEGRGHHGLRHRNFFALANVRVEVLLGVEHAERLLERLSHAYEGRQVVAFFQDVEAWPKAHFA
jgi:nitrogen regulatory protein PII